MIRTFIIIALLFSSNCIVGQVYISESCTLSFFSEAPLENIEAVNTAAAPVLSTKTNDLQVRVPIKGFVFENALMQEHFNENYMESDIHPHATFKGKILEDIDFTKDGEHNVSVKGTFNIHGVDKEATILGTITIKGDKIMIAAKFRIHVADYKIKVPNMYVKNIAEDVDVKIDATLKPYVKN